MDKEILVERVKALAAAFEAEGKHIDCVGLVTAYPEYDSSPFILVLSCPWMVGYNSCYGKTQEAVKMMYKVFEPTAIKRIHAVSVFDNAAEAELYMKTECKGINFSCLQIINTNQPQEAVF